jgi:hypothetical protein
MHVAPPPPHVVVQFFVQFAIVHLPWSGQSVSQCPGVH